MGCACYAAHYSLTVVCPAVWEICRAFKWERSIQTIVKILLHLYVFLYELVKTIILNSTLGQHFTTIKWKGLALLLLQKESWPKRHNFRKHNWETIKKISLLPYEAISQPNTPHWDLKSERTPLRNSFISVHNLYRSSEGEKNGALAFNPEGFLSGVVFVGFFTSLYSPFPSLVTITAAPYLQLWAWIYSSPKPKQGLLFWFRTRDIGGGGGKLKPPFLLNFSVISVIEHITQQPTQYDKLQKKLHQLRLQKIIRPFISNLIVSSSEGKKLPTLVCYRVQDEISCTCLTPLREDFSLKWEEIFLAGNPVHVRHRQGWWKEGRKEGKYQHVKGQKITLAVVWPLQKKFKRKLFFLSTWSPEHTFYYGAHWLNFPRLSPRQEQLTRCSAEESKISIFKSLFILIKSVH